MSDALTIAWKDLTEFRRNRITLIFSIIMPILMIGMIGLIFQDSASSINKTPVGLIVDDMGILGQQVASMIDTVASESGAIQIVQVTAQSEVHGLILAGDIRGAIVIPHL
jgi:ABC-type Na+ efflux pump permease subunit